MIEPVRKKLIAISGSTNITEDMYPDGNYFDDKKVQIHNNIPWKIDFESSDTVDGYTVHKPV